jgi:hypothetical protein
VREALDWIAEDLVGAENLTTWSVLHEIEPDRTRIELFGPLVLGQHRDDVLATVEMHAG